MDEIIQEIKRRGGVDVCPEDASSEEIIGAFKEYIDDSYLLQAAEGRDYILALSLFADYFNDNLPRHVRFGKSDDGSQWGFYLVGDFVDIF